MDCLRITGGMPLEGRVMASGSKNAALPIMAASILASAPVQLANVPNVGDVRTMTLMLERLGIRVNRAKDSLWLESVDHRPTRADARLVRRMRASICVLGPLLARRGQAAAPLPGGCKIGERPIDLHLAGLAALGAEIRIVRGWVMARATRLRGTRIDLRGPFGPTVTGTANVMCAATLARGRTIIIGAASEPEVVDLGQFLVNLGARIHGLGSDTIEIEGVDSLAGGRYSIINDRIEAGTLLLAGAITGGRVSVEGVPTQHLDAVLDALSTIGCDVRANECITISRQNQLMPANLVAEPFPGLPTDLQPQFLALLSLAAGRSTIRDRVFPERFAHAAALRRFGARSNQLNSGVAVRGVDHLSGARVSGTDLRAAGALVLAALAARGESRISRLHHLDRGYERLEAKLSQLGARIARESAHLMARA